MSIWLQIRSWIDTSAGSLDTSKADKTNVLQLNNTTEFTPDADYEPATKKYVDDNAGGTVEGADVLSTGEAGGTKFLREDGDGTCSWQTAGGSFSGDMDDIPDGTTYVKTENNFTDIALAKLSGIAAGAEVNVNADWNAGSGDAQILNKPIIPVISDTAYDATSWNANTDAPTKNAVRDKIEALDLAKLNRAGGFMNGGLVYATAYISADGTVTLDGTNHVIVLMTDSLVTGDVTVDFDAGWDSDGRDYIICAVDIDATYDVILSTSTTIFELPNGTTTNTITLTDADNGKVFMFKALTTVNGNVWKQTYPDANIPTVSDVAYDATTWDGNTDAPTKNAVRDKFESLTSGGLSQPQIMARISIGF